MIHAKHARGRRRCRYENVESITWDIEKGKIQAQSLSFKIKLDNKKAQASRAGPPSPPGSAALKSRAMSCFSAPRIRECEVPLCDVSGPCLQEFSTIPKAEVKNMNAFFEAISKQKYEGKKMVIANYDDEDEDDDKSDKSDDDRHIKNRLQVADGAVLRKPVPLPCRRLRPVACFVAC